MLTITDNEWFDLHHFAMVLTSMLLFFVAVIQTPVSVKLIFLAFLLLCLVYFFRRIKYYIGTNICVINHQWFIRKQDRLIKVDVHHHWLQTRFLCISLRGSENAISFVIARSIIGPERFSQLRAIIT